MNYEHIKNKIRNSMIAAQNNGWKIINKEDGCFKDKTCCALTSFQGGNSVSVAKVNLGFSRNDCMSFLSGFDDNKYCGTNIHQELYDMGVELRKEFIENAK